MKQAIAVICLAAILGGVVAFVWQLSSECSARGGVLVRGVVWPACVARV